ncbi:MAG: Asp-tRNA(Asn)/Glu-tRNA(Gln) amidotransferase subunit GatA [Gemmatimonadota bacterium]
MRTLAGARAIIGGDGGLAGALSAAARGNEAADGGPEPVHAFLCTRPIGGEADGPTDAAGGSEGDAGPLAGVPVGVKDNLCTLDFPTTCGSRILEGYRSPYEATAVRRLRAAGAVVFGKTNCDEFAMGSSTENSAYGPTRNPVARDRVPGGSSGGSAAAVAAGIVPVALGSSTGGSVRQPASFCGIVGVKPTYGRVSRYGLVAFASSLDQVGVLAGEVRDAAVVLEAIAGPDARDATSGSAPPPRAAALRDVELRGRVIGIPRETMGEALDPEIRRLCEQALRAMEREGAELRDVSLPHTEDAIPCYYVIAPAEASSNLARFDGVRYGYRSADADGLTAMLAGSRGEGFGHEVKRRIMLGTYALSAGYQEAFYNRAQRVRAAIAEDFVRVFEDGVDALFAPTTPTPAFRLGEKTADPYEMYLSDIYTVSANLAGIPAVSIPIGNASGLPVGGQFLSPAWDEETMLGLAARLEDILAYRHPLAGEGG